MLLMPNGKPFTFSLLLPATWSDFVADGQLIRQSMKAAGIDCNISAVSFNAWTSGYTMGNFDATIMGPWITPGPFETFNPMLNSSFTAPVGQSAANNYGRWTDKATDEALNEYSATQDPATQKAAMQKIQDIMVNEMPMIPLFYATSFTEFTTTHYVGWPSDANQYEMPTPQLTMDEVVLLHLTPAK